MVLVSGAGDVGDVWTPTRRPSLTGSCGVVGLRDLQHRHSVSVAGVVVDGERVLTIRRADTGAVQIPGGVLEVGI